MTARNTVTVGQPLRLLCEVITVRGITSRVDTVWSSNGTILLKINDTTDNLLVYTSSYTILELSTADDGRVIQCEGIIRATPTQSSTNTVALDIGKCVLAYIVMLNMIQLLQYL